MLPLTSTPVADWPLAGVLVVLLGVAVLGSLVGGLGVERNQVTAALRAVGQLAIVSTLIVAVMRSLAWSFAFVALMYVVASVTAARRLGARPGPSYLWVALAIAGGAFPVVGLCLGSGVIPMRGAGVIPIAGIVIGGAMIAATLAGRRAFDELTSRRGEFEAALALGLPTREAAYVVIRPAGREALVPGLDQTRTVGLVTLPGAFVGVILGGGTAIEAGAAQVLVLVGLLAAQSLTVAGTLWLIGTGTLIRSRMVDTSLQE